MKLNPIIITASILTLCSFGSSEDDKNGADLSKGQAVQGSLVGTNSEPGVTQIGEIDLSKGGIVFEGKRILTIRASGDYSGDSDSREAFDSSGDQIRAEGFEDGKISKAEDEAPVKLERFVFPITESADEVLRMFSRDFNLKLRAFLEEQGIEFRKGADCTLDSEENRVEVTLEQQQAALVVWVLGDIMQFKNSATPPTKEALVKRYYPAHPRER